MGPHRDKQVHFGIAKGRSRSGGRGKSTVDTGTTDIRASKTEIPKMDLTTTKMRVGPNQSAPETRGEPGSDGRLTVPVDERALDPLCWRDE